MEFVVEINPKVTEIIRILVVNLFVNVNVLLEYIFTFEVYSLEYSQ